MSDRPQAGVVTFYRLDDANRRVTAQRELDPEGFVENVGDKTGMLDRRVKGDMKRFREFIEARGAETGAWRGDVPQPGYQTPTTGTQPAGTTWSSGTDQPAGYE